MRRVKLDSDGCSVNFDHVVSLERKDGYQFARLVSGTTVGVTGVYPLAHDLFQVSRDVWVNPVHVSVVGIGYNKDAAFRDVIAGTDKEDRDYTQVYLETVLGANHKIWPDLYGVDELDNLAGLLDEGDA